MPPRSSPPQSIPGATGEGGVCPCPPRGAARHLPAAAPRPTCRWRRPPARRHSAGRAAGSACGTPRRPVPPCAPPASPGSVEQKPACRSAPLPPPHRRQENWEPSSPLPTPLLPHAARSLPMVGPPAPLGCGPRARSALTHLADLTVWCNLCS
uniref:Uncharacterized protein n=1 Tax=Strix occidentalis caurina TaxID=311401 RepID=A0A8D0EJN8_STROC